MITLIKVLDATDDIEVINSSEIIRMFECESSKEKDSKYKGTITCIQIKGINVFFHINNRLDEVLKLFK